MLTKPAAAFCRATSCHIPILQELPNNPSCQKSCKRFHHCITQPPVYYDVSSQLGILAARHALYAFGILGRASRKTGKAQAMRCNIVSPVPPSFLPDPDPVLPVTGLAISRVAAIRKNNMLAKLKQCKLFRSLSEAFGNVSARSAKRMAQANLDKASASGTKAPGQSH